LNIFNSVQTTELSNRQSNFYLPRRFMFSYFAGVFVVETF